jgi:hypothetical protein
MDAEEREIYYYLKSQRPISAAVRDISRRVGGRRKFHYSPDWVNPVLERMLERGILETKQDGSYAIKPPPRRDTKGKRWASPEIAAILKTRGKTFGSLITPEDEDAHYENL